MRRLLAAWLCLGVLCAGGSLNAQVAKEKADQARQLVAQGRYEEATRLALDVLAAREKKLGANHPDVAGVLIDLAMLCQVQNRSAEAEAFYRRSLSIVEKVRGPNHPEVARILNVLASLIQDLGRYAEAEPLYKRSLAIREKAPRADPSAVAQSLGNLASLYYAQGRYGDAEPLFKRAVATYEKAFGANHPAVAAGLNNLALLYDDQGRYAEAEPLYRRSLAMMEATGADEPDVAAALNNLASLYKAQGRYAEAEPIFKRSVALIEKALGPDHPEFAGNLGNLAGLYLDQGRHAEAESLYRRSLAIREAALGADHPDVANSLNNLAMLYKSQGRAAEAEPLVERSLIVTAKALGVDHPAVATGLLNLASLYQDQGRHGDAEAQLKRSLAITEKALGADHPDVVAALNNLATLYLELGRYGEAEPLLRRGLSVGEKALGRDHPDLATSLNNLALLYGMQGRYGEAEPFFKRSLVLNEKAFGPDHPDVALSLSNLAGLHLRQGRLDVAVANSRRAAGILSRRIDGAADERTPGAAAEQRSKRGHFLLNIEILHAADRAAAGAETFRVAQLARASTAAGAVAGMAARFAAGTDALARDVRDRQDLAARWRDADAGLVKTASQPPGKRNAAAEAALRADLAATGQRLDALDARIAREFPRYAELSHPPPLELGAAQALLAPDEALLVYLVDTDKTWLWVLRRDRMAMHRLAIGAKSLSAEVKALRERLDADLNKERKPFDAARAHALYEKILAPAKPLLDGAQHVLVAPDGALESLPIGVLVTTPPARIPETPVDHRAVAWFAREHALTVLPSVGSLRALRQVASATPAALPFVGIGAPVLEGPPSGGAGIPSLSSLFRGRLANVAEVRRLPPLPETADELRAIARIMGAEERALYLAERASEPVLREARLDRYRIIEFATHGLMSGQLKGLTEPALVLTPPTEASPANDGLLTASEVATLKLNADWVVLSACNTAAADGTPDAGGLSGLAKAFFYAGARSLLVSHWSVPSQATVKLVTTMFDALMKEPAIGRAEALRRAEMAMIDPSSPPEFAHPLYWAPFVLAGEGARR